MSHVLRLLEEIRSRPGMYIGAPSLTRLAYFMLGFDYGVGKCRQTRADPFLAAFRDWIHNRYGSSSDTWEGTIRSHCATEAEAFGRFWELLDEFLKQYPECADTQNNGGALGEKELQTVGSKRPA